MTSLVIHSDGVMKGWLFGFLLYRWSWFFHFPFSTFLSHISYPLSLFISSLPKVVLISAISWLPWSWYFVLLVTSVNLFQGVLSTISSCGVWWRHPTDPGIYQLGALMIYIYVGYDLYVDMSIHGVIFLGFECFCSSFYVAQDSRIVL